jgi:hypothetical protein
MECEQKLRSYLRAFREEEISGMNQPMDINESVTVVLKSWVHTSEDLEIIISIDNMYCRETARNLHKESGLFNSYVSLLNEILVDEGYDRMDKFTFVEEEDIFDCKPYKYKSSVSNPV